MRWSQLILWACLIWGRIAAADSDAPKPWAVGVSDGEQAFALKLYDQGNVEFQNARFEAALELYLEAIKHWDHPAIRYNMAVSYNNLGQLLDAEDNLERALRYGEEPLGHDIYAQGLNYKHNFESRLSRLIVACKEPETQVSLDGRVLFVGPGSAEKLVLPGEHQIVAVKPGFLTASERLDLKPGALKTYDVRLVALKSATHMERRWPAWQPWALAGAGVVVAGFGGLAYLAASSNVSKYDAGIASRCPHGCDSTMLASFSDLNSDLSRSRAERDVEIALLVIGGAAAVAGAIGIALDTPYPVAEHAVAVPTRGGVAVGAAWRF